MFEIADKIIDHENTGQKISLESLDFKLNKENKNKSEFEKPRL